MFWFSGGVQLTTILVTSGRTCKELGTSGTRVSVKEKNGFEGFLLNKGHYMKSYELVRLNVALLLCIYIKMSTFQKSELYCRRESNEL